MLQYKILRLDVGSRMVGTAISDIMDWAVQGLGTPRINKENNELGIDQLVDTIKKYNVGTAVMKLPRNMNNSIGFRSEASLTHKEELSEAYPSIEIMIRDRRLSTMAAERSLLEADVSRRRRKQVIDEMVAVFVL